ncbi:MAG: TetR/AcrR family transcriptional regulator, partial [Planctomycetota bacterium]
MPKVAPHMRDTLARCALDLFAERGINNVTLDEVAAKAGVTKGSLYWHFKSRKEVILAAAAVYYHEWQQMAHDQIASTTDPLEQIRRVWRNSLSMCLFNRGRRGFSTEMFALGLHDAEIRASWSQFYDTVHALFAGLVLAACNAGRLYVEDPRRTADWMLASFEGIKHRASFQPQMCTPSERDTLVEGF